MKPQRKRKAKARAVKREDVQRARRDEAQADKRGAAERRGQMFRPRKPVNASFVAQWDFPSSCPVCGLGVDAGQRARYNPAGAVVHHGHAKAKVKAEEHLEVCPTCWLAKPCEHDDETATGTRLALS